MSECHEAMFGERCQCEGPFEYWEGDHTDLVHVLWGIRSDGLLPGDIDCDEIATRILGSHWFKAVRWQHLVRTLEDAGLQLKKKEKN